MKWPRGKYNGKRIVGVRIEIVLDVTRWALVWPSVLYGRCLGLGPLRVWFAHEYDYRKGVAR